MTGPLPGVPGILGLAPHRAEVRRWYSLMSVADEEANAFGTLDRETAETTRLVLELIHVGYGVQSTIAHAPLLAAGRPPLSQQAVRAAINLYLGGELSMGEVAASASKSNAWASRVIDELIEAGIVERVPDADDRRVIRVRLVPEAIRPVEEAYNWRGDAIGRALAGLDETDRRIVREFLARAIAELTGE
jgi:DNA-binding MarR family transcriptional regulator